MLIRRRAYADERGSHFLQGGEDEKDAGKAATFSEEQHDEVTGLLCGKTGVIDKLMEEVGGVAIEDDKERE